MSEPDDILTCADRDGVRLLTLNRPRRRNAIDTALGQALLQGLREADADPAVGAVVIAGNGPVFCAGADLAEFKGERASPAGQEFRSQVNLDLLLAFSQVALPVLCAVQGAALGLGAALVNVADLAVFGRGARLGYPEVGHGMVPSLMIPVVQKMVGAKQAFEVLTNSDALSADQALALGLCNRVVDDAEVLAVTSAWAARLAALDRTVLRETKLLIGSMRPLDLADALRFGTEASRRRAAAAQLQALGGTVPPATSTH